ncbi:neurturin-like [Scleropages formosus]|uniref:neurturin-like n=1 Tax=Scleropages formosus TaxID=113540 RepID=UPI0010FAA0D9|nr:neurturin [Scleropages formosus]
MRLWKWSAAALALCGTVLLDVLTRSAVPTGPRLPRSWPSTAPRPQPPPLSSSSRPKGFARRRTTRTPGSIQSILAEFSSVFQSFTEGELQHVIAALVDRKAARDAQRDPQGRRTRRARGEGRGSCSLREAVVSVTELGLGYDSDETLLFRYCSGRCAARRRNYDVSLEHMKRAGLLKGGRRNKVRRGPCCRPIAYDDDVSFLDNNHRYYTIHEVSARACACV